MKKTIILTSVLFAWAMSLSAQITREQATAIVLDYLHDKEIQPYSLCVSVDAPNEEGIVLTTYGGETIKAKYACWVYYTEKLYMSGPYPRRYLFVKEDNGNLLEVIVNDLSRPGDPAAWEELKAPTGLTNPKENTQSLYPNPVDDWLIIPCKGENVRVEILDLKGTRLFSGTLLDKDACRLNVSFLSAGIYVVNVSGEMYKMIKK